MPKLARKDRPKHPASRANGQARRIAITTGGQSRAVWGRLDRRFGFGRAVNRYLLEYRAHIGEAMTAPLADLCESAARHRTLANLAFADLAQRGVFDPQGNVRPAFAAFRQADSDLRACLQLLGFQRRMKPALTLQEYLAQQPAHDTDLAEHPTIPSQPENNESASLAKTSPVPEQESGNVP